MVKFGLFLMAYGGHCSFQALACVVLVEPFVLLGVRLLEYSDFNDLLGLRVFVLGCFFCLLGFA
jgi:predicted signal transduction protein with EAL and GGDEF domain